MTIRPEARSEAKRDPVQRRTLSWGIAALQRRIGRDGEGLWALGRARLDHHLRFFGGFDRTALGLAALPNSNAVTLEAVAVLKR